MYERSERHSDARDSRMLLGLPLPRPAPRPQHPWTWGIAATIGGSLVGLGLGMWWLHPFTGSLLGAGTGLGLAGLRLILPGLRRRRAQRAWRRRLHDHRTEEWRIQKARWKRLRLADMPSPILVAEIAPRETLLLWGDCLEDPTLYGLHADADTAQIPFPCADFLLVRSPRTGMVLGIRSLSPAIGDCPTIDLILDRDFTFPESCLLRGTIDDPLLTLRSDRRLDG